MRAFLLAVVMSGLFGASMAADSNYSSEDVLNFLVDSALGKTRGICVGTAEECATPARPAGFDVLVNFDLDSANLRPDAKVNLDQVAKALLDPRLLNSTFAIEGFTDASGSEAYNQDLAQRRAQSVAEYLVAQGVSRDVLMPVGMGEAMPRVPDPYDPANRRVEMRLDIQ